MGTSRFSLGRVLLAIASSGYPVSCTTRMPCRRVIRAFGQRGTAARYVASATSKSSTPSTCSTILLPVSSQISMRKAKWVLLFMYKSDSTRPGPALSIAHVGPLRLLQRLRGTVGNRNRCLCSSMGYVYVQFKTDKDCSNPSRNCVREIEIRPIRTAHEDLRCD